MKWVFWGQWDEPLLAASFWVNYFKASIHKRLNFSYPKRSIKVLSPNFYYVEEDFEKITQISFNNVKQRKKSFFNSIFKIIDKTVQKHFDFEQSFKEKQFNEKELVKNLEEYFKRVNEMVACWTLLFWVSPGIRRFLEDFSKEKNLDVSDIFALVYPPRKNLFVEESILFDKIVQKIKKNKLLDKIKNKSVNEIFRLLEQDKGLSKNINDYFENFGWVGTHSFWGEGITKRSFIKRIIESDIKEKKQVKTKKIHPEISLAVKLGSEMAFYRTYVAEVFDKVNYTCRPLLNMAAKKLGIKYEDIINMTFQEILKAVKTGDKINKKILEKRKKGYGIMIRNGKETIIVGDRLAKEKKKYEEKVEMKKELKGIAACKGVARGVVKIVSNPKDISKVKKGDILIAAETTPDFIVAMEKAAAFVTNQGGITSHAAIISREMKKPCIIGTKNATKILKDGDNVEVDADKGIVRKMK